MKLWCNYHFRVKSTLAGECEEQLFEYCSTVHLARRLGTMKYIARSMIYD